MKDSNDKINYDELNAEERRLVDKISRIEHSEQLALFIANLRTYAKMLGVEDVRDKNSKISS